MAITSASRVLSFTAIKACFFAVSHQIAVVLHLHTALLSEQVSGLFPVSFRALATRYCFGLFLAVAGVLTEIPDNILFLRNMHWGCI